jgi:putative Ig domain-containing protein
VAVRLVASLLVAVGAITAGLLARPSIARSDVPRVTVIGDSVMTGVLWHPEASAVMESGLDVDWEVAVCRRLEGVSCPYEGKQVPTVVDLVPSLGSNLAPTVVVEMGYNDFEQTFAKSVDDTVRELVDAGVKHILWVNLRAVRHPYVDMNTMLSAADAQYPELTLIDWNRYSRSHPEWFQNDGEHLFAAGGVAMATLVHDAVVKALTPVSVSARRLPVGHVGRRYAARLVASGGTAPYRFRVSSGRLPRGLRLALDGRLAGVPKTRAHVVFTVSAADATGSAASAREVLTVTR